MPTFRQRVEGRFFTLIELMRDSDNKLHAFGEFLKEVDGVLKAAIPESLVVGFGSFMRHTAVRTSDMDVFWIVPPELVKDGKRLRPATVVMSDLQANLRGHIDPTWQLDCSYPALIIRPRGRPMEINVVPTPPHTGRPGLTGPGALLAQGDGRWKFAAPIAQRDYLREAAKESDNVLIFVARFFKLWRDLQRPKIELPSYYVEYVLHHFQCCAVPSFLEATLSGFRALEDSALTGVPDPLGIDRRIYAAARIEDRQRLARALSRVRRHVDSAWASLLVEDDAALMRSLNYIFKGSFPSFETRKKDLGWGRHELPSYPGSHEPFPPAFLDGPWRRPVSLAPAAKAERPRRRR